MGREFRRQRPLMMANLNDPEGFASDDSEMDSDGTARTKMGSDFDFDNGDDSRFHDCGFQEMSDCVKSDSLDTLATDVSQVDLKQQIEKEQNVSPLRNRDPNLVAQLQATSEQLAANQAQLQEGLAALGIQLLWPD